MLALCGYDLNKLGSMYMSISLQFIIPAWPKRPVLSSEGIKLKNIETR